MQRRSPRAVNRRNERSTNTDRANDTREHRAVTTNGTEADRRRRDRRCGSRNGTVDGSRTGGRLDGGRRPRRERAHRFGYLRVRPRRGRRQRLGLRVQRNRIGWEEIDVGEETVLAVFRDGQEGLAAGEDGFVYERTDEGKWKRLETPTENELSGVTLNDTEEAFPDVAVGGGPTAIERGEYAALPQTIVLSNGVSASIDYWLEIDGEIEADDADARIENGTVSGTLEGGETHEFAFDGRIVGVEVTPLRLADLTWQAADSPVESALNGVATTTTPIAAGEDGVILRREDGWPSAGRDDPRTRSGLNGSDRG